MDLMENELIPYWGFLLQIQELIREAKDAISLAQV